MRLIKWSLMLITVVSFYAAAQQVAQPTKDGVGIYKNEIPALRRTHNDCWHSRSPYRNGKEKRRIQDQNTRWPGWLG